MLDQYRRIKLDHPGEVLFFRLGDFYEMFFEDAIEISALLNLTLTNRAGQPMCGVPYHASRTYISRLLKAGKKVAICEQLGDSSASAKSEVSKPGKGLIDRKVTEVITPGTTVDDDFLEKGSSNYLACLAGSAASGGKDIAGSAASGGFFSFSYIDLSVGAFYATSFSANEAAVKVRQELERIQAKELIVQESLLNDFPSLASALEERNTLLNRWADWLFDPERSRLKLEKQFGCGLQSFGLGKDSPEIISAGALLDYLDDTARSLIPHVRGIKIYGDSEFVNLDESTQRNLELVRNLLDGESRFSLFEVMDETRTAMGRRLLKNRLLHPLRNRELINKRLCMVESFYHNQGILSRLREMLYKTPDLQRLCSRLAMDKAHGKDLVALRNALFSFKKINEIIREDTTSATISATTSNGELSHGVLSYESAEASSLKEEDLEKLENCRLLLEKSIADDPSILLTEGNLIRPNYSKELDGLRELKDSGRKLLEDYLEEEKAITGISGLKIRYNRLIGYFFEVSNVNLSKVPSHFIRRQGLAGAERFTTDRLANLESDINGAQDKIIELEKKLFIEIRGQAKSLLAELTSVGHRLSEIDAAQGLARAATIHAWTLPLVDDSSSILIKEGRHPVVEAHLRRGEFIPNSLELDASDTSVDTSLVASAAASAEASTADSKNCASDKERGISFALITGPNMAGKSTYLRQAALITLMAQCGSFVPASEAKIGMVDSIYCRVGASDNLARGESTFLVEMNETAYILRTATNKSLVIMDEVGRGTGIEDGLSIAWAVCEELLNNIKCRTLFATHYHELSRIAHPRMANRSMEVVEQNGHIVFLRKLREGAAEDSYGINVAGLAGIPDSVLERAAELMNVFRRNKKVPDTSIQVVYDTSIPVSGTNKLIKELESLNINEITPLQAINILQKWKKSYSEKAANQKENKKTTKENKEPDLFV